MTDQPYKDKKGKLRFDLIPPEMDRAFAEVSMFGIEKLKQHGIVNPERNWEHGLKLVGDHLAAVKRHINEWEMGADADHESHLNPLAHAHWHLSAMVTQIMRGRGDLDDRPAKKTCIAEELLDLDETEPPQIKVGSAVEILSPHIPRPLGRDVYTALKVFGDNVFLNDHQWYFSCELRLVDDPCRKK
jgi:hypothetical protein